MDNYTRAAIKLFKQGNFELITQHSGHNFVKQEQALKLLTDHTTTELLLGGAAGGAKSYTAWVWLTLSCMAYPGIVTFMARETLKTLVNYGISTFNEVCKDFNIINNVDYKYNAQSNIIHFKNGEDGAYHECSRIHLIECKLKPSDHEMHGLGSSLFTFGAIEEGSQIQFRAYDTLTTRINRKKNDQYNLLGKLLTTANPSQGYLYRIFYLPNKRGDIAEHMTYLPVLAIDNPFKDKGYMKQLENIKDPVTRDRLMNGNWEYNDNPNALLNAQQIHAILSNSHIVPTPGKKYITLDPAGEGADTCIFMVWNDWQIEEFVELKTSTEEQIKKVVTRLRNTYQIEAFNVIVDSIGVGHFLVGEIGARKFNASRKATERKVYENIKTEAGYKLVDHIHKVNVACDLPPETRDEMTQELGQLQTWKADDDKRKKIKPKDHIKKFIGRSPGILDNFLMRSFAELNTGITVGGVV